MNKAQLIEELTKRLDADRKTATAAVETLVDTIVRAVSKGESVTITGFGVFEKRRRAPRVARNPRTGETVKVRATSVPSFRPGAQFKDIIAGRKKLKAGEPAVKRTSESSAPAKVSTSSTPRKTTPAKKAAAAKKTAATKTSPAKKAAAKASTSSTARKTAAAKKATPAKKAAAKASTSSTPRKTAAAKKATPAKKTAATKTSPAKVSTSSTQRKTTARKSAK